MPEMTPAEAEHLARGYAWGQFDGMYGEVCGTLDGIDFGIAYREHMAKGNGSRWSVQRAYAEWLAHGYITEPPPGYGYTITKV